jgi:hypothetical protein
LKHIGDFPASKANVLALTQGLSGVANFDPATIAL